MANIRIDGLYREGFIEGGANIRIDGLYREAFVPLGCTQPPSTGNFNYLKTFAHDNGDIWTLALDSLGILWREFVNTTPNVLKDYDDHILPGSYCRSVTAEDEEWMVFSNLIAGTDIPRHGSNLDRISQVGPGIGPSVVGQTGGTNVFNIVASPNGITQQAAFSDPGDPGFLFAANWSAGPTSTAPGNVLTVFYMDAEVYIQPYAYLVVGGGVYVHITAPSTLVSLTGTYIVTGAGQAVPPGGNHPCWYFTVATLNTGNVFVPGTDGVTGTFQMSLATLTTTTPATIQVNDQVTLAGVTTATWDGAYTILNTLNGGQYLITSTSLTTNVATYNYTPVGSSPSISAGDLITVTGCTNGPIVNGTSIFNVTSQTVATATSSVFTIGLVGPNVTTASESGSAIVSGTIFQIDPGLTLAGTVTTPIYGNSGGGTISTAGPLSSGTRQAVTIFQTRNGYLTAPSPPTVFETSSSTTTLQVTNIAIGPPNVIARIVAFTGANGGNFFYIPVPVTIAGTGQPVTYSATVVTDNVSTSATFTFTDAVLLAATAIDVEGNNLFNQIELGSSLWDIAYADRMFYGGENNKVQNLVNTTFDGGYLTTYPAGWGIGGLHGSGGSLVQSQVFGNSYNITNSTGSTQVALGVINQPAYQDAYQVPIILPSTLYSVRIWASGSAASGVITVDLFSSTFGTSFGVFSVALNSLTADLQLFTGTLLTTAFATQVPKDLQLRLYAQEIPDGGTVTVDRLEVFPTAEPVLTTELQGSYVNNLEAFDGVTGNLGVGSQNNQPALGAFVLYDTLYILKSGSLLSTQDSPGNEPSDWTVREVSNRIGVCGINAYDSGEEWAVWANQQGLYAFNGGEPIKISQEIQPTWDAINWQYGYTIWLRNDIRKRKIHIGVPMSTPNQWLPNAPTNANPSSPNVVFTLNYKELNTFNDLVERGPVKISFTGKLISWDISRKWSIWQIPSPYADFIERNDGTWPLFFGCGDGSGQIGQQVSGLLTDYGNPIDSLYTSYGFVKASDRGEFGPLLSAHRNLYKYLDMNLSGTGPCDITVYPNTLSATYPFSVPSITLANPIQNNVERPINVTGNRAFVQWETSTSGSGFSLSSCTVSMVKDPHAPVRGLG